jgi:hypothetical protein
VEHTSPSFKRISRRHVTQPVPPLLPPPLSIGSKEWRHFTITLEALKDGKIRASSSAWADAHVILPDQVFEAKWESGQVTLILRPKPAKQCSVEKPKDFEEFL